MNTVDCPWKLFKRADLEELSPSRHYYHNQQQQTDDTPNLSGIPPVPLSNEEEKRIRCYWATFMQTCGLMLELPNATICTAIVFMHRFYAICAWQQYEPLLCVQAALLVASKVEENSRRARDIINVCYRATVLYSPNSSSSPSSASAPSSPALSMSQYYWDMKELVLRFEQQLLRVLGYELSYTHPHCYLLHITRHLECSPDLAAIAYYLLNDSMKTSLCLQYSPPSLACAAVYLASEMVNETVRGSGGSIDSVNSGGVGSPVSSESEWWEEFHCNRLEIEDVSMQMMDL